MGVAREVDLDRRHRRYGETIASRRHQHLSKAIRRGPKIPAPAVDQTRCYVRLTRHISYHCTRLECRHHNRLLLLDAPPTTPFRPRQHLDTCHCTVSCTGANTGVCTTAQLRQIRRWVKDGLHRRGTNKPGQPLREIKKFWSTVMQKAGITNYRRHDNRHTYASHLVSSGLSLEIVGRLLGHTTASTTKRYAHLADDPLRAATERFGSKIAAFQQEEKAEVIPLRSRT
jgi:hypothetical protein